VYLTISSKGRNDAIAPVDLLAESGCLLSWWQGEARMIRKAAAGSVSNCGATREDGIWHGMSVRRRKLLSSINPKDR